MDSDDSTMPPLVSSQESEDSDCNTKKKTPQKKSSKPVYLKAKNNEDSAKQWALMELSQRKENILVMKIYLLSPFLFGTVFQSDKWINWMFECGLLPSKSKFDHVELTQDQLSVASVVEDAFTKVQEYAKSKEDILKVLSMMEKVNKFDDYQKAITCAESFTLFPDLSCSLDTSKKDKKRKEMALLLALNQYAEHVFLTTRKGKQFCKEFEITKRRGEKETFKLKEKGNEAFEVGRFVAAICSYEKAIRISPYNHILYGNRCQSFLKTNEFNCALADGKRAVILKPTWDKGQYRYAEALCKLNMYDKALLVNTDALKLCEHTRDLDKQHLRIQDYLKDRRTKLNSKTKLGGRTTMVFKNEKHGTNSGKRKLTISFSDKDGNETIPDLVDENSDENSDLESYGHSSESKVNNPCELPDLLEISDNDVTDSDDESDEGGPGHGLVTSSDSEDGHSGVNAARKRTMKKKRLMPKKLERVKTEVLSKPATAQKAYSKVDDERRKPRDDERPAKIKPEIKKKETSPQADLRLQLKQASEALLSNKNDFAVVYFEFAIKTIREGTIQYFGLEEIDFVVLLYSHGMACVRTGTLENIQLGLEKFESIICDYRSLNFPLAFYGVGKVYFHQNRFQDAIEPFEKCLEMDSKLEDERVVYCWPGTENTIAESEGGKLKSEVSSILSICKYPPRPDAICRFIECKGKTYIYCTDPDYKGFISLLCCEGCDICFHPSCWKKFKTTFNDKSQDKDFLDVQCFTPDCGSTIRCIRIYDNYGLKTEAIMPFVKENKTKQNKMEKMKGSSSKKMAKREERRREREAKRMNAPRIDETPEKDENEDMMNIQDQQPEEENTAQVTITDSEQVETNESPCDKVQGYDIGDTLPPDVGVYILRKGDDEDLNQNQLGKGNKGKSKKSKKTKNVQTLDQFLGDYKHEGHQNHEFDEIPPPRDHAQRKHLPSDWNNPMFVDEYLDNDGLGYQPARNHSTYNLSYEPETPGMENFKDSIFVFFVEILKAEGPMEITDDRILQPFSLFPMETLQFVQRCGGIRDLLSQSKRFIFVENTIYLAEDVPVYELAGKLKGSSSVLGNYPNFYPGIDSFSVPQSNFSCISPRTAFNPDAEEFVPVISDKNDLKHSFTTASSNKTNSSASDFTGKGRSKFDYTRIDSLSDFSTATDDGVSVSETVESEDLGQTVGKEQSVDDKASIVLQESMKCQKDTKRDEDMFDIDIHDEEAKYLTKRFLETLKQYSDESKLLEGNARLTASIHKAAVIEGKGTNNSSKGIVFPSHGEISPSFDLALDDSLQQLEEIKEPKMKARRELFDRKTALENMEKFTGVANDISKSFLLSSNIGHKDNLQEQGQQKDGHNSGAFAPIGGLNGIGSLEQFRSSNGEVVFRSGLGLNQPSSKQANSSPVKTDHGVSINSPIKNGTCYFNSNFKTDDLSMFNNHVLSEQNTCTAIPPPKYNSPFSSPQSKACVTPPHCSPFVSPNNSPQMNNKGTETPGPITSKSKGVQAQPQTKTKHVMTEPLAEPFKADYQKAMSDKDQLEIKLQEYLEKQMRLQAELESLQKTISGLRKYNEDTTKQLKECKSSKEIEITKLQKEKEEKDSQAKSAVEKLKVQRAVNERFQEQKKEFEKQVSSLTREKDDWNNEKVEAEDIIKKLTTVSQENTTRAQNAEVLLLELRRDVGVRFLERALQEANLTIANLERAVAAKVPLPQLEEFCRKWKEFAEECQARMANTRKSFDEQVRFVKEGTSLSTLQQLPIAGPPPYPGPPILQPLIRPNANQSQNNPTSPQPSDSPLGATSLQGAPKLAENTAQPKPLQVNIPTLPQHVKPAATSSSKPVNNQTVPLPARSINMQATLPPVSVQASAPQPVRPVNMQASAPSPVRPVNMQVPSTVKSINMQASATPVVQPPLVRPVNVHAQPPMAARFPSGAAAGIKPPLAGMHSSFPNNQPPLPMPPQAQASAAASAPASAPASGPSAATFSRPSNSFERIMLRLSTMFPAYTRVDLTGFIKEVRASKNGSLTGLSLEDIVNSVSDLIAKKEKTGEGSVASGGPPHTDSAPVRTPKYPLPGMSLVYEEEPCVICHDDMNNIPLEAVNLECGHRFHTFCIRKWLLGEQSTCPTCRVHALLPDEYPKLK